MGFSKPLRLHHLLFPVSIVVIWCLSLFLWDNLFPPDLLLRLPLIALGLLLACGILFGRPLLPRNRWLLLWLFVTPLCLAGLPLVFSPSFLLSLFFVLCFYALLPAWAWVDWWPLPVLQKPHGLHTASFACRYDVRKLLTADLPSDGLLIGRREKEIVAVRPTLERRELGNMLIVGPTRCGKGLLATSELLSWQGSVVVNDIKGELFTQTAGFRSTLGPVFVIDPTGIGHRFDPLVDREGEDQLYSAAASLLYEPKEGDGKVFTQRATLMLTQLFLASRRQGEHPFPYVRSLLRLGLTDAARWLHLLDPKLATQFLDCRYEEANLKTNRFLLSAWETLSAKLRPLLTERVIRTLAGSDFALEALLLSDTPVTVYFRWPERDLIALSPLIKLLWDSIIGELITTYDKRAGRGCQPVLMLVDEAGRTAIPTLSDHATTVVGRGISLWFAVQSLSQLETVYGPQRAQVLRDNMETQVYYRPTDVKTARYLEERIGQVSVFASSLTLQEGRKASEGKSERAVSLLAAQEALALSDTTIIAFHRNFAPMRLLRLDWRASPMLKARRERKPPDLKPLPEVSDKPSGGEREGGDETCYVD